MRRTLAVLALLLASVVTSAQPDIDFNRASLPLTGGTITGTTTFNGPARFSDGTLSAPAITFAADTDTGVYRSAANQIEVVLGAVSVLGFNPNYLYVTASIWPAANDTYELGSFSFGYYWRTLGLTRSIQGSKTKALTEGAATAFTRIAVPQTAGVNFAGGEVIYTVYETDGTDSTVLTGVAKFNCANKAGTETCSAIVDAQTTAVSTSGVDTLACTITAVTGLTDVIDLAANCTDTGTMTQTTLNILARLDMPQPNTVTPQ